MKLEIRAAGELVPTGSVIYQMLHVTYKTMMSHITPLNKKDSMRWKYTSSLKCITHYSSLKRITHYLSLKHITHYSLLKHITHYSSLKRITHYSSLKHITHCSLLFVNNYKKCFMKKIVKHEYALFVFINSFSQK